MTPRTVEELRSAVARVLMARKEPPDALRVVVARGHIAPAHQSGAWLLGWHVHIAPTACGLAWDGFVTLPQPSKPDAVEHAWRGFVTALENALRSAGRSRDATRDPVAAQQFLRHAKLATTMEWYAYRLTRAAALAPAVSIFRASDK